MQSFVISISVCQSVHMDMWTTCPNFSKISVAVASSSSDSIVICYMLPVLRMTSYFPIMGSVVM